MAEEFNSKFANVVSDLNISFNWNTDPEIEAKRSNREINKEVTESSQYIKDQGKIPKS